MPENDGPSGEYASGGLGTEHAPSSDDADADEAEVIRQLGAALAR